MVAHLITFLKNFEVKAENEVEVKAESLLTLTLALILCHKFYNTSK